MSYGTVHVHCRQLQCETAMYIFVCIQDAFPWKNGDRPVNSDAYSVHAHLYKILHGKRKYLYKHTRNVHTSIIVSNLN